MRGYAARFLSAPVLTSLRSRPASPGSPASPASPARVSVGADGGLQLIYYIYIYMPVCSAHPRPYAPAACFYHLRVGI